MSGGSSIFAIFLINCMLVGFSSGLIGHNVKAVRSGYYNFVVSLSRKQINDTGEFFNHHFCTGTLISHKSIVTAAHCLVRKQPDQVVVIAGSNNLSRGSKFEVESWTTFDQWNQNQRAQFPLNDIAVIILKGEGCRRIRPALALTVGNEYLVNKKIRLVGWGNTETGRQPLGLRAAYSTVVSNQECSNQGTMLLGKQFTVPNNYFCSKAEPWIVSTSGDGGGPILNRQNRLVGINIGTCPNVDGYPQDMLNQLQMNSHLHLYFYRDFLNHVML